MHVHLISGREFEPWFLDPKLSVFPYTPAWDEERIQYVEIKRQ